jgi:ABC-type protease/lipase transport system fused ATPase/permease subunit
VLAVLGPSGAGKSTLIRMAAGAGFPDRGAVRLDGAALADWPADQLAENIGYLPQDFVLFPGSIKENISRFAEHRGIPSAEADEGAVQAARAVGAHEMILRLPQGYDAQIGFDGAGLSAGQRQRIALARAFYGQPRVLVLDEPNAHLDPEGEAAMIEALRQARARGAAVLMVVHRGGAIRVADRVLVLKEGQVKAFGTPEQVLPSNVQAAPRPVSAAGSAAQPARPPIAEYRLRA